MTSSTLAGVSFGYIFPFILTTGAWVQQPKQAAELKLKSLFSVISPSLISNSLAKASNTSFPPAR